MAEIIKMPKLSDTMEEGVVAEWHKKVGDTVESGDLLAEIETDKATMEFESFQDGVLLYIGVEKGAAAPVDSILAILGEEGENIDELIKDGGSSKADESKGKDKEDKKEEEPGLVEKGDREEPLEESKEEKGEKVADEKVPASKDKKEKSEEPSTSSDNRIKASPLAKKLAEEKGVDLANVNGTGDGGRIIMRDIENFSAGGAKPSTFVGKEKYTEQPLSQMRKTIAKRLAESKFTAPHFYLTIEIDMDNAIDARKSINKNIEPQKISFNDMVIKAVASSLRKNPKVNSAWLGDKIRFNEHIHIGVAVAVDEGLLVPVVRFADGKTLTQIGAEVKEMAQKAKSKKLQPQDWEGNTFTISNLGMFGIDEFTAIINPPDACILAIGGIAEKPVVKNGQIVPGNIMKVTMSCDHRVVDGAVGSAFLQTFKKYMENPVLLLGEQMI